MINIQFEKLRQQIIEETDGSKFSNLIKKLLKIYSLTHREDVLKVLTEYSKNGKILHWREFLLPNIIELINHNETTYSDFFEWCITQPKLTYWAIDGLIKTKGKNSYPALIELAKSVNLKISIRAKSIKSIATFSNQPFDRQLPEDPGYWKVEDLRIDELEIWQRNDYPDGKGYEI